MRKEEGISCFLNDSSGRLCFIFTFKIIIMSQQKRVTER